MLDESLEEIIRKSKKQRADVTQARVDEAGRGRRARRSASLDEEIELDKLKSRRDTGPPGSGSKGVGRSARSEPYASDDRSRLPGTRRVAIRNLSYSIMAEDLEELFADSGLEKAWIDYDSTDRSIGSGGLLFAEPLSAADACWRYNGSVIDGQKVFMELDRGRGKGNGKGKGRPMY
mmetsp:Transcript_36858/g.59098  ORF Transcript_36858/g.59098 Transcript_36858/m.59098 type:complete len:177 (+) Transcript_36858:76-606(+)